MNKQRIPILVDSLGTQRHVTVFRYGPASVLDSSVKKIYVQAALHADEMPGALTAHYLGEALATLDAAGSLKAEFVLVPLANPIGLSQRVQGGAQGRFLLRSGENFNRHFPNLHALAQPYLDVQELGADTAHNVRLIRKAIVRGLADSKPHTELQALRHLLVSLACDADWALDLHSDQRALVHLYTAEPSWPQVKALARALDSQVQLLAPPGGHSFDDVLAEPWISFAQANPTKAIPMACLATTVELRGQADVSEAVARGDAARLLGFFRQQGFIDGSRESANPLKEPSAATPLAATEPVLAPVSGIVLYDVSPGDKVEAGQVVARIVDPTESSVNPVRAQHAGTVYAHHFVHFAMKGEQIVLIAGSAPIRRGPLLSA
ncbi:MAG: succinylglutamate desuccinylase [Rhizobacter sp.]|nr:succinylglutamate desuccinylase [Rhizobacter sp.]